MLLTLGKVSVGDFGEESLVGRLLLSLVFNEHAEVNKPGARAFRAFASRCLGLEVLQGDVKRTTVTVEFQANRCGTKGDATTFDSLLTLETDWVWGIEAKYFDLLKREQIEREAKAIQALAFKLGYEHSGLLFIAPEQQLGTVVTQNGEVISCLQKAVCEGTTAVRLASWEMVSSILVETGTPEIRHELEEYWGLRNQNKSYSAKVSVHPRVKDWREWESYILGIKPPPRDLPKLPSDGGSFSRFGQASAELCDVFAEALLELAEQIVTRARRFGFQPKAQKTGYVNLSHKGRAHAQIHPHPKGVALVVREAAGEFPSFRYLEPLPYQKLRGYKGRNKLWLDGDGKVTFKPAAAVLVPADFFENPEHDGWLEVDDVLGCAERKRKGLRPNRLND